MRFFAERRVLTSCANSAAASPCSLLETLFWRQHARPDQELFLDMMRLFCGLSVPFFKAMRKSGVETEYIAPELLPSREDIEREIAAQWDADTAIEVEEYRYEFLHQGLIRAVIAKIGLDAGLSALYWRDGLCAYEEITRSRAVIEQRMDPGWSGRIVVQTRGGQARQLLSRLCNLVEEQQNRIGLEAVRKGPTIPVRQEKRSPDPLWLDRPCSWRKQLGPG